MCRLSVLAVLCFLFVLSSASPLSKLRRRAVVTFSQEKTTLDQDGNVVAFIEGAYGGVGGGAFNDGKVGSITAVTMWPCSSNPYLGGIQVTYIDGQGPVHGQAWGSSQTLSLSTQEYIVTVSGRSGWYIDTITLTTNAGRSITMGSSTGGNPFSENAPSGQVLGSILGSSGSWVDKLNFVWRGPLADYRYVAPFGTGFELSTVNPRVNPITSLTLYTCSVGGVSFICGYQITAGGQSSSVVGAKGTPNVVTIPGGDAVWGLDVFICNVPTLSPASQTCGITFHFTSHGDAKIGSGSLVASLNWRNFVGDIASARRVFRGFKGTFKLVSTYAVFNGDDFGFQD